MVELTLITTPPHPTAEPSQIPPPPPPPPQLTNGTQEHFSYKSRLQEYTQKLSLPLPAYLTRNEGDPHAPLFRATVWVDKICCTSPNVFKNKKSAEQEVAKVAFDALMQKVEGEGSSYIHEDTTYCKAILHEFAANMHLSLPTYQTTPQQHNKIVMFATSLNFNGDLFAGPAARSKKEAEQLAARAAILSVMGTPGLHSAFISKIIKSKYQLGFSKGNASNNEGLVSSSLLNKENENVNTEVTSDMAATEFVENQLRLLSLGASARHVSSCIPQ